MVRRRHQLQTRSAATTAISKLVLLPRVCFSMVIVAEIVITVCYWKSIPLVELQQETLLPTVRHWADKDCSMPLTWDNDSLRLSFANASALSQVFFPMATHNPKEDCPISFDIHEDGCYECHVLRPLLRTVELGGVSAILDIGANIGLFGLSVAAMGRSAYMIEPARVNQDKICVTIQTNQKWKTRNAQQQRLVKVFTAAAVDDKSYQTQPTLQLEGTTELNKGGITLVRTKNNNNNKQQREGIDYARTITINALQDQLPPAGSTIVLKIDVEGNECNALNGALKYLRTVHIAYCAIEWSQTRLQQCENRQAVFDLFADNHLKPYQAMLNETTHPVGWMELDPTQWDTWMWNAPNRKHPERALFDVAWARTKPQLEGPIVPKIRINNC